MRGVEHAALSEGVGENLKERLFTPSPHYGINKEREFTYSSAVSSS